MWVDKCFFQTAGLIQGWLWLERSLCARNFICNLTGFVQNFAKLRFLFVPYWACPSCQQLKSCRICDDHRCFSSNRWLELWEKLHLSWMLTKQTLYISSEKTAEAKKGGKEHEGERNPDLLLEAFQRRDIRNRAHSFSEEEHRNLVKSLIFHLKNHMIPLKLQHLFIESFLLITYFLTCYFSTSIIKSFFGSPPAFLFNMGLSSACSVQAQSIP